MLAILVVLLIGWIVSIDRVVRVVAWSYGLGGFYE